jgi:predicted kinase
MLIVLGGLPGTGKSTLAKAFAARHAATYLRIDEIEQALYRQIGADQPIGVIGYGVALAIARSNLQLGNTVVADCVNPVAESREGWRRLARAVPGTRLLEIEVICSDKAEHRRRIEQREPDIAGHSLPDWASVKSHSYTPWTEPRLVVDTALLDVPAALAVIEAHILPTTGG